MAAPPKPWESVPPCCQPQNVNNRMAPPEEARAAAGPQFQSTLAGGGVGLDLPVPGAPPPIPTRPATTYPSYGGMQTPYGAMQSAMPYGTGYGGYGNYGGAGYGSYGTGYGSYAGGYGGGYSRPGLGAGPESWFIQAAEEGSRSTFESIESFVSVFTSISQMMESTYMLVHSSFRAVVGVAEQLGRMRLHLTGLMSAISLMRVLRWCLNFFRRWLGYPEVGGVNSAWTDAISGDPSIPAAPGSGRGSGPPQWPVFMYLAAVVGAPYLIYRMLRARGGLQDSESWKSASGEHFSAVASYTFSASGPAELSITTGQDLRLAPRRLQPRVRGWVLASDGTNTGLVPASYVKIRGLVPEGGPPGVSAAGSVSGAVTDLPPGGGVTSAMSGGGVSCKMSGGEGASAGGQVAPSGGCCSKKTAPVEGTSSSVSQSSVARESPAEAPAVSAGGCCSKKSSGMGSSSATQTTSGAPATTILTSSVQQDPAPLSVTQPASIAPPAVVTATSQCCSKSTPNSIPTAEPPMLSSPQKSSTCSDTPSVPASSTPAVVSPPPHPSLPPPSTTTVVSPPRHPSLPPPPTTTVVSPPVITASLQPYGRRGQ